MKNAEIGRFSKYCIISGVGEGGEVAMWSEEEGGVRRSDCIVAQIFIV